MINEDEYIGYVESLAIDNKTLNHTLDGKKAFFYIEEPDDTNDFDKALRDTAGTPCMLLVADDGEFDDNGSNNYTQEINGQIYILAKLRDSVNRRQARAICLPIVVDILAKMRSDSNKNQIVDGKKVHFRIEAVPYQKVGPMNVNWYGYTIWFTFVCPFGFTVTSASWRSIT